MTLTIYNDIEQGSERWYEVRRGIPTASVMHQLVTPTLKVANNDTSRNLILTLAAERITGHTEETYIGAAMERGMFEEPLCRGHYTQHYAEVVETGFMAREFEGVRLGFSPDGIVGDDGLIEIKSRNQRIQVATILKDEVPAGNMAQIQTGLLVSGRNWLDYLSYSGGMPMYVKRVYPDDAWFSAIIDATKAAEASIQDIVERYTEKTNGLPLTERVIQPDDMVF